ncbi:MAG: hypothetical protein AMXMBFR13_06950 [Phycisphaerae bacterium]
MAKKQKHNYPLGYRIFMQTSSDPNRVFLSIEINRFVLHNAAQSYREALQHGLVEEAARYNRIMEVVEKAKIEGKLPESKVGDYLGSRVILGTFWWDGAPTSDAWWNARLTSLAHPDTWARVGRIIKFIDKLHGPIYSPENLNPDHVLASLVAMKVRPVKWFDAPGITGVWLFTNEPAVIPSPRLRVEPEPEQDTQPVAAA